MNRKGTPLFKSAAELERLINGYFVSCGLGGGDGGSFESPPTVSGLAMALGFSSREDLLGYCGKDSYRNLIDKALLKIEDFAESRLFDKGQYSGAKFFLEGNFKGWDGGRGNEADTLERLDAVLKAVSAVMTTGRR